MIQTTSHKQAGKFFQFLEASTFIVSGTLLSASWGIRPLSSAVGYSSVGFLAGKTGYLFTRKVLDSQTDFSISARRVIGWSVAVIMGATAGYSLLHADQMPITFKESLILAILSGACGAISRQILMKCLVAKKPRNS